PEQVHVQIRARGTPCPARWQWQPQEDVLELTVDTPAFAVALGQAAVLYDGDVVLGGGIISARLDTAVPRDALLSS
ncbi:MAG: aminomethyltransferase beta-barrel domain-containing protein, partial [Myxococcota bacterium]